MGKIVGVFSNKEYPRKKIARGTVFAIPNDNKHYFVYLKKLKADGFGISFTRLTDSAIVIENCRVDYEVLYNNQKDIVGKISIEQMWCDAIMKVIEPQE